MYSILNRPFFIFSLLIISCLFACKSDPKGHQSTLSGLAPTSLQIRLLDEPDGLSPILARYGRSRKVYRHLYTRLLEIDPVTLDFLPQLATSEPKSETLKDGMVKITFNLRTEAKWSDGKPLTVNDLVFSYKILKHPVVKTRYGAIADLIDDIEINPSQANEISFLAKDCHISLITGIAEMFIYPEHIFDPNQVMRSIPFIDFLDKEGIQKTVDGNQELIKVGERFMDPSYVREPEKFVTSSAYTFKEWITGQRIVIQKKKDWWGEKIESPIFKQKAKEIQFQIIPDNTTAITQLANGEIDAMSGVTAQQYDEYKSKENLIAKECRAYETIWLTLNTQKGILSDRLVRKALAYACDEEAIIKNARNGYGNIVTGPFMPGTNEYNNKVKPTGLNIAESRGMLKAAGWADSDEDGIMEKIIDGKKTNLSLDFSMASSSTTGPLIGEILKNSAKKAGFEINLIPQDNKINRQNLKKGDFDIALKGTSFSPGLYDPKGRWHSTSFPPNGLNYSRFGTAESDAIIDKLRSNCDNEEERTDLYHRLHAMIEAEQPVIFLYNTQSLYLINKRFDNIIVSPNRPGLFEEFLTLK